MRGGDARKRAEERCASTPGRHCIRASGGARGVEEHLHLGYSAARRSYHRCTRQQLSSPPRWVRAQLSCSSVRRGEPSASSSSASAVAALPAPSPPAAAVPLLLPPRWPPRPPPRPLRLTAAGAIGVDAGCIPQCRAPQLSRARGSAVAHSCGHSSLWHSWETRCDLQAKTRGAPQPC